jgi:signal transduction histidine kinase/ActR/RegA family two-component response regulator
VERAGAGRNEDEAEARPSAGTSPAVVTPVGEWPVLAALERVNRIIFAAPSLEAMLTQVLDALLELLDCDRAWLLLPCDPSAATYAVPMERTRPEWPGAGASKERIGMTPPAQRVMSSALRTGRAVRVDGVHTLEPVDPFMRARFSVRSMMFAALHPRAGEPWLIGIHHCAQARVYDDEAATLLESIGARVADGLTGFLAYRASTADRRRLESAQRVAQVGSYDWNSDEGPYCSPELLRLCGFGSGFAPDTLEPFLNLVHAEDRDRVRTVASRCGSGGGGFDLQIRAFRKNLEWFARVKGEVHLGSDTRIRNVSVTVQDVTAQVLDQQQRAKLEGQLLQSQKLHSLGQLTGGVAHDFNNLLTVMLGNLSELVEVLGEPERALPLIEEVNAALRRATELTRMLTAFARKQPLQPKVVNVNTLLARLETLLRRAISEAVGIEVDCAAGLWNTEVDPVQLENALLNLALNARDAMINGGKLQIRTENTGLDPRHASADPDLKPGQYVLITVTDNGMGMSASDLAQAFEPFFTTKGPGRGTGLGLSMVYGFVKQSGGHIRLHSEVGIGTRAEIYLPRCTSFQQESIPPARSPQEAGSGERILLVEDQPEVRVLTTRLLLRLGYQVSVAHDAESALRVLESDLPIALLFTDVVLTGEHNGAELASLARALRPALPVLFTSGYTEDAFLQDGRLEPGVQLLEKPFTRETLGQAIRRALERARRAQPS